MAITYKFFENELINNLTRVAIIVLITILSKIVVDKIFDSRIKRQFYDTKYKSKAKTIFSILRNFLNIIIYFIAITAILNVFGVNTSSIIAVAGVGGMAVAFAAKSVIEDVITGAFILFENQFNIGDTVTIDGITGKVKFMGIRLTKLKDVDGREIIFPNSQIRTVINHSQNDMRCLVTVNITSFRPYEEVKEAINKALDKAYSQFSNFASKPEIKGVENFTEYSYLVRIDGLTKNGYQFDAQRLIREEILKELIKDKISFSTIKVENKWFTY